MGDGYTCKRWVYEDEWMPKTARAAGYSLFELIILMVVLSVVCYFIFLNESSFTTETPEEMEAIAVEMVRVGIHNYAIRSNQVQRKPVYPLRLDEAPEDSVASPETPLFTAVFPQGLQSGWYKFKENQYMYGPGASKNAPESRIYYYDSVRGSFTKEKPAKDLRTVRLER